MGNEYEKSSTNYWFDFWYWYGDAFGYAAQIAQKLATTGFAIAFHSRSSTEKGKELADFHPDSSYTQADFGDREQAGNLIQEVLAKHDRLDILVNNAGITKAISHNNLKAATPEIWQSIYEVNVIAPWTLITEAETALKKSSSAEHTSCIINITSHAGIRPKGASIPYAVSKAALNHMTKLLALNLAPKIRVNAIAPGLVNTPMSQNWDAARKLWQDKSPMQRGAQPAEIAHIASMMVASNYLNGETIIVDGGLNLT